MDETKSPFIDKEMNVGTSERVISLVSGSLLLLSAAARGKGFFKTLAGGYLVFRGATGYCPATEKFDRGTILKTQNVNIKTSLTVNKPRKEVYEFWRKLENLPLFMKHLENVKQLDKKTSQWTAKGPKGIGTVSWKSEIVDDDKNVRIGWHSLPGSSIQNAGNVHFKDAGKFGTEVHAIISYHPPAGKIGEEVTKLLNPLFEGMVEEDLKNFKRYMESGEIPTIKGQPSGKDESI